MRLQKRLSRKVKGKEYVKGVITIPPEDIRTLGWKEGEQLDVEFKGSDTILIKKLKKQNEK